MNARICGVASQMQTFKFLFGILLAERTLQHTNKLNKALQNPQLPSTESHVIAMLTVRTLFFQEFGLRKTLISLGLVLTFDISSWVLMSHSFQEDARCPEGMMTVSRRNSPKPTRHCIEGISMRPLTLPYIALQIGLMNLALKCTAMWSSSFSRHA